MMPVRLEHAALGSRVKHSTTEPLPSHGGRYGGSEGGWVGGWVGRIDRQIKDNTRNRQKYQDQHEYSFLKS